MEDRPAPTELSLKGQRLLEQLRGAYNAGRQPLDPAQAVEIVNQTPSRSDGDGFDVAAALAAVSEGRGYHSARVTDAISVALRNRVDRPRPGSMALAVCHQDPAGPAGHEAQPAAHEQPAARPGLQPARSYPTISLEAVRHGHATLYRLWLIARAMDHTGSGWVYVDDLRWLVCSGDSPARCMTARRYRQLVADGQESEPPYWTIDQGSNGRPRLRYTSAEELARGLGLWGLSGAPVWLQPADLTGRIAEFKASLLSSWHAGRHAPGGQAGPISRAALAAKCGVSERTITRYHNQAAVSRSQPVAIAYDTTADRQDMAYRWRTAYRDLSGLGLPARLLPNIHQSPMMRAPRGRQRKIARSLSCAGVYGAPAAGSDHERLYFDDVAAAAAAHARNPGMDQMIRTSVGPPDHMIRNETKISAARPAWAVLPGSSG